MKAAALAVKWGQEWQQENWAAGGSRWKVCGRRVRERAL